MILYIARHGESLSNAGIDNCKNSSLSPLGVTQAKLLGERMKNFKLDCILSSPLIRASATAEETAKFQQCNIEIDDMLVEVKNAETKDSAYARATAVISKIKDRFKDNERIMIFAHGTFNNYLINAAIGFPVRDDFNFCQENTGLTCIKFLPDGRTKIEFANNYCHLAPLGEIEY